ncbi:MAG: LPS-assembly protein LptD [Treponema sp.]|nr:LPS-assembly protein LptD [Treponema sp.]
MTKRLVFATFFVFLFSFAVFSQNDDSGKKTETTIITINNARQTSYKKAEDSGNDTIVLEGSVSLSVEKGSSKNEIRADKVTYDRQTEMLYAEGNIEIIMKGGSSGENTASASSLMLNTSTLEGVFDGGRIVQTQSDALNLPSGSTLIVFSEIFAKGNENVITFKNSSLTFCDEDPPHWHIDATRTWLLPGGEFAFFNALLYVGVVPVLYFPAFYYPKDELIFNPVFGYAKREGFYVQTTTYLWGRKPLATDNVSNSSDSKDSSSAESLRAVYNFVKSSSLKEQVREGLVLHNLDEDFTGSTSQYVKVLADWYSNIGFMLGVDGKIQPSSEYISHLNFNFMLGFSNTVFKQSVQYFPYSSNGKKYNDESVFLGMKLPFRYGASIDFELSKPFKLNVQLPIYSDPYFENDFKNNRTETMDWISYFLDSSKNAGKDPVESETSELNWKISSSYSPPLPAVVNPYISSLSLNLDSDVRFSKKNTTSFEYDDAEWKKNTPMRKFYYPSSVTPLKTVVSVNGTIFAWPPTSKASKTPSYIITMNKPDELKTQKELEENNKSDEQENQKKSETAKTEDSDEKAFDYLNPELDFAVQKENVYDSFKYSLKYDVKFKSTSQLDYSSSNLTKSEDFDWSNIRSSMYNINLPIRLTSDLNYGESFFTLRNAISFTPVFQEHTYISTDTENGGYNENSKNNLICDDYKAEKRDLTNENTITLKPFVCFPFFSDTSIKWDLNTNLYQRKFTGTADEVKWENNFIDLTDENTITRNELAFKFALKEMDNKFSQSLTFSAIMPPILRKYSVMLNLEFPFVKAGIGTGFKEVRVNSNEKELKNKDAQKEWQKDLLTQNLSISLFDSKLSLSENYSYDLENNHSSSLSLSAAAFGMHLNYNMSYVKGYDFDKVNGWSQRTNEEFLPTRLSFSYELPQKTYFRWFNRITVAPTLSTSIEANLLKATDSYFLFNPGLKFKINELFDISFSATIKNSIIYWYFHNQENDYYSDWGGFPGNIAKDLIDSFRFDNEELRKGSGFKLKALKLDISHDLHDWKFNMSLKIEPRIISDSNNKRTDYTPYITIGIVWNPMESMKTTIIDDYGEWKLE